MGEEKGRRLRGVEEAGEPGNLIYFIYRYYVFLQSLADTNYGYTYVNSSLKKVTIITLH